MKQLYDVFLDGKCVGIAEIAEEGLYYRISCKCRFPPGKTYKVFAQAGAAEYDLGTYITTADTYGISTRVARKHIRKEQLCFVARGKRVKQTELFVPIDPDKPFPYLTEIKNARFAIENGQPGVIIKRDQSASDGP